MKTIDRIVKQRKSDRRLMIFTICIVLFFGFMATGIFVHSYTRSDDPGWIVLSVLCLVASFMSVPLIRWAFGMMAESERKRTEEKMRIFPDGIW